MTDLDLSIRTYDESVTPEERLAAVAHEITIHYRNAFERIPDYADYREAFRPYLAKEILLVRIDEARVGCGRGLTDRVASLRQQLVTISDLLPKARRPIP